MFWVHLCSVSLVVGHSPVKLRENFSSDFQLASALSFLNLFSTQSPSVFLVSVRSHSPLKTLPWTSCPWDNSGSSWGTLWPLHSGHLLSSQEQPFLPTATAHSTSSPGMISSQLHSHVPTASSASKSRNEWVYSRSLQTIPPTSFRALLILYMSPCFLSVPPGVVSQRGFLLQKDRVRKQCIREITAIEIFICSDQKTLMCL